MYVLFAARLKSNWIATRLVAMPWILVNGIDASCLGRDVLLTDPGFRCFHLTSRNADTSCYTHSTTPLRDWHHHVPLTTCMAPECPVSICDRVRRWHVLMLSQVVMGQLHYQGAHGYAQDYAAAARYFEQAANAGDAQAMQFLGEMYANGRGVKQDNDTARSYYERAVDKKNPTAIAGLGLLYKLGQGVPKNEKKAFELFKQAADMEDVDGHLHLANQYFDGLGTKRDYRMAIRFYSLAAKQGHVLVRMQCAIMVSLCRRPT